MKRYHYLVLAILAALIANPANGEPTFTLSGTVSDLSGNPVAEAEVYLYRTANTRRQADFISPKTLTDGKYRVVVPAGNYWGVARIKKGERSGGPLQTGQRHSGDPQQLSLGDEPTSIADFTVADLREMAQKRQKVNSDVVTMSGVIVDKEGNPAANAYAFASRVKIQSTLPEYISAWTGTDGLFTLYLPPGDYYWGASREFPPNKMQNLISFPADEGKAELKLTPSE